MPIAAIPVKLQKTSVGIALVTLAIACFVPDLRPAHAGSPPATYLICTLMGRPPTPDFSTRLCKRMATAFQAKLQPITATQLVASGKAKPADTIIALTITVKSPYALSAIAKSGTPVQWRSGRIRTSLSLDVSISDARLNDAAIENLAQSARFLLP